MLHAVKVPLIMEVCMDPGLLWTRWFGRWIEQEVYAGKFILNFLLRSQVNG